jgi:hypothetical protein
MKNSFTVTVMLSDIHGSLFFQTNMKMSNHSRLRERVTALAENRYMRLYNLKTMPNYYVTMNIDDVKV